MALNAGDRYREAIRIWQERDSRGAHTETPPSVESERIAAMQAAIRAVPLQSLRRQKRGRALAFFYVAAALVSLGFGLSHWRRVLPARRLEAARHELTLRAESSSAILIRGKTTRFVEPGTTAGVRAGDEISVSPGGQARLRLPSAAFVELEPATRLRIARVDDDESVDLVRGAVSLRVPRLPAPHTLSVTTPDARVVVHGTQFRVAVSGSEPSKAPETSVAVSEGEVAVIVRTGHRLLRKGEQWHSSESAVVASEPPVTSGADEPSVGVKRIEIAKTKASAAPPPPEPSPASQEALAEQNRLYRSALAAKRVGDERGAVALLSELIERYPDSPLAAEALGERARLQARSSRDGGR